MQKKNAANTQWFSILMSVLIKGSFVSQSHSILQLTGHCTVCCYPKEKLQHAQKKKKKNKKRGNPGLV